MTKQAEIDLDYASVSMPPSPPASARQTRRTVANATILSALILVGITMMFPFVWTLSTSLKETNSVYSQSHNLLPRDPVTQKVRFYWHNYVDVWQRPDTFPLGSFYTVSVIVAVFVTAGRVFTSSLAGYAFARLQFPGRDKLFLLYLATLMVPAEITMIPTFIIIGKLHWMNTFWALIVPGVFTSFGTFMLRQFFLTIPAGLEDAARIDGCSQWGIWWRIFLPLSGPALVTLAIFTFLGSWNDFMWPLIVTHTTNMMTIPVGLAMLKSDYSNQVVLMLAASVQVLIPVLLIFIVGQKRITEGIATSGFGGR
jgi:multiple sugar transport system permease protein